MPFAVALLCHPAGAYGFLMLAVVALVHASHSHRFVPAFTAVSAAALALLAFLHTRPDAGGLLLLTLAVVLVHAEFFVPTYGTALLLGIGAGVTGSWLLLEGAVPEGWPALTPLLRAAIACAGTLALLAVVVRGLRLRTLTR